MASVRNREQLHLRGGQRGPVEGYNDIHNPQLFFSLSVENPASQRPLLAMAVALMATS